MKITDVKEFSAFETQLMIVLHRIAGALEDLVELDSDKV